MPQLTLTTLPREILGMVVKNLSPFRSTSNLEKPEDDHTTQAKQHALWALSKTCKPLKEATEPFLFEDIDPSTIGVFCAHASRDPNVFKLAKSLDCTYSLSFRVASFFEQELSKLGVDLIAEEDDNDEDLRETKIVSQAMVVLATNLQRINYNMEAIETDPWTNDILSRWFRELEPERGLPNLRWLTFTSGFNYMGFDCSDVGQAVLMGAAPNLERLRLESQNYATYRFDNTAHATRYLDKISPCLANLRVLELSDIAIVNQDLYMNYFRDFLERCPKLETLVIERATPSMTATHRVEGGPGSESWPEPWPAQLLEACLPVSRTIECLEFLWQSEQETRQGLASCFRRDQLLQFKQLRTLIVHERCFCRKFIELEPEDLDMGLVDMLPPFVESLVVVCDEDKTDMGDVEALIARVEEFPALREISEHGHYSDLDGHWRDQRKLLWKRE